MLENIADRLRNRGEDESGFTLVELLVVMLILGILAAIAIPSFFNQRDKARDADAKAAIRTAQTAMETYATDNNGSYTGATVGAVGTAGSLVDIESSLAEVSSNLTLSNLGDQTYTIQLASDTGNTFEIVRTANGTDYNCSTAGDGGCPSSGDWSGTVST